MKTERLLRLIETQSKLKNEYWGMDTKTPTQWTATIGSEFGNVCEQAKKQEFGANNIIQYKAALIKLAASTLSALEELEDEGFPSPGAAGARKPTLKIVSNA
jgi:hypothetical protein